MEKRLHLKGWEPCFHWLQKVSQEVDGARHAFKKGERSVWRSASMFAVVHAPVCKHAGPVKVLGVLRLPVEGQEGVGVTRRTVTQPVALLQQTTMPHHLSTLQGVFQVLRYSEGPVCLQEHVDHSWGSVAPVHQQVSVVPDTGRVVSCGELETTDVVHAGLHQPVYILLHTDEARLRGRDQTMEDEEVTGGNFSIVWQLTD